MTWAQRLKRIFGIDMEACAACGGEVRIVAGIEIGEVIEKVLARLSAKATIPKPQGDRRAVRRPRTDRSTDGDDPTTNPWGRNVGGPGVGVNSGREMPV